VYVAGDFNQWSATATPMQKDGSGVWTAVIPLKPGKYQYKFVVDGNWKQDPLNPDAADDTFGGRNSVKSIAP
jgi:1,4-alpha-glucan branching enzyme